jgi:hypothetical protein
MLQKEAEAYESFLLACPAVLDDRGRPGSRSQFVDFQVCERRSYEFLTGADFVVLSHRRTEEAYGWQQPLPG